MSYEKALRQYIEATNTHNFANVKQLLHEDAVYWFTDKTCKTEEEIQQYFENAWTVIQEEVYSATDVQWLSVDEYSATSIYTYHYEGYANGQFVSGSGRATNLFVKDNDGNWKIKHEHLSSLQK
ncbi:YybH family protein [Alkalihalobacterium bogoriense]|uniref:YybH family protein n=1 Tax=Alkalihalobacterium bogoriense TaxID=246272 RepID=UPI000479C1D5|nr:nuclear transport factor 2 family protein [Alkalihalobacterium bogoriense]